MLELLELLGLPAGCCDWFCGLVASLGVSVGAGAGAAGAVTLDSLLTVPALLLGTGVEGEIIVPVFSELVLDDGEEGRVIVLLELTLDRSAEVPL